MEKPEAPVKPALLHIIGMFDSSNQITLFV